MILDWKKVKIFLKPGVTDFRKQIDGLSVIVREELKENVFSGVLFMFCSKNRSRLKILYWDKNGFCLWMKRLEKDKFPWPKNSDEKLEIDFDKFKMLLSGIDFFHAHKELKFTKIL
ncbi:MAG TPA: IS66 family insertion sequence element accessory protein TnpB [Spirochaetota bacterium]|nr:IS66 family insertion sequence element accessory protein TnpB [Spirochaetota bacterium]